MKFTLEFDMDNAYFTDAEAGVVHGAQSVLNDINRKIGQGLTAFDIFDGNGNKIGAWAIEGEPLGADTTPVAYWVVDPEGDYIERHPAEGSRHDGDDSLLDSFKDDAKRSAEQMRASTIEDRKEEGEDYPDDPAHVSYVVAVEYANGDRSSEVDA